MFDWLLRSFIFGRFKHLQHLLQTVKVAKKSSRGKKLQLFALNRSKSEDDGHEISREKHFGELQTEKENALHIYFSKFSCFGLRITRQTNP